jgi:hypothetical protein
MPKNALKQKKGVCGRGSPAKLRLGQTPQVNLTRFPRLAYFNGLRVIFVFSCSMCVLVLQKAFTLIGKLIFGGCVGC